MPTLLVACPVTGNPISTHLIVSSADDIRRVNFHNVRILLMCPHCDGKFHLWKGENGFVEGAKPPSG
jgi:hypothetical protein